MIEIENSWVISPFPDINECSVGNGGCDQMCLNKAGTFECACNRGWIMQNGTCVGRLPFFIL